MCASYKTCSGTPWLQTQPWICFWSVLWFGLSWAVLALAWGYLPTALSWGLSRGWMIQGGPHSHAGSHCRLSLEWLACLLETSSAGWHGLSFEKIKRYRQCSKKASLIYKDSSSSCWCLPFWGPIDDGNSESMSVVETVQKRGDWERWALGSTSVIPPPAQHTVPLGFLYLGQKCSPGVCKVGFSLSLYTHTRTFSFLAHRLSCSMACGIFPDWGSNPHLLHWQADSSPLSHQGSPGFSLDTDLNHLRFQFPSQLKGHDHIALLKFVRFLVLKFLIIH